MAGGGREGGTRSVPNVSTLAGREADDCTPSAISPRGWFSDSRSRYPATVYLRSLRSLHRPIRPKADSAPVYIIPRRNKSAVDPCLSAISIAV